MALSPHDPGADEFRNVEITGSHGKDSVSDECGETPPGDREAQIDSPEKDAFRIKDIEYTRVFPHFLNDPHQDMSIVHHMNLIHDRLHQIEILSPQADFPQALPDNLLIFR